MKPASAKQKGRKLQQWVRDRVLSIFPSLTKNDVRSTAMGQSGQDVQLSESARSLFPFAVECKSRARIAVYQDYEQAQANAGELEPLLIIKQNQSKPLAIVDAEWFFSFVRKHDD